MRSMRRHFLILSLIGLMGSLLLLQSPSLYAEPVKQQVLKNWTHSSDSKDFDKSVLDFSDPTLNTQNPLRLVYREGILHLEEKSSLANRPTLLIDIGKREENLSLPQYLEFSLDMTVYYQCLRKTSYGMLTFLLQRQEEKGKPFPLFHPAPSQVIPFLDHLYLADISTTDVPQIALLKVIAVNSEEDFIVVEYFLLHEDLRDYLVAHSNLKEAVLNEAKEYDFSYQLTPKKITALENRIKKYLEKMDFYDFKTAEDAFYKNYFHLWHFVKTKLWTPSSFISVIKELVKTEHLHKIEHFTALYFPIHFLSYYTCKNGEDIFDCPDENIVFNFEQTIPGFRGNVEDGSERIKALKTIIDDGDIEFTTELMKKTPKEIDFIIATSKIYQERREDVLNYFKYGIEYLKKKYGKDMTEDDINIPFVKENYRTDAKSLLNFFKDGEWNTIGHQIQLVEGIPIQTQWAQDCAKPGKMGDTPLYSLQGASRMQTEANDIFLAEQGVIQGSRFSPLRFDGGDILIAQRHLFVGENTISQNSSWLFGLRPEDVKSAFEVEFGGKPVIVLPPYDFHIDLFITPLNYFTKEGKQVILLADHGMGINLVLEEVMKKLNVKNISQLRENIKTSKEALQKELKDHYNEEIENAKWGSLAEFPQIESLSPGVITEIENLLAFSDQKSQDDEVFHQVLATLQKNGYYVVTIPGLPTKTKDHKDLRYAINYNNVVLDGNTVYIPHFPQFEKINAIAHNIYASFGLTPIPIETTQIMMPSGGAVHCGVEIFRH